MSTRQCDHPAPELIEVRRELWRYTSNKPNKAPPADSPNRPMLARLWWAAHQAIQRNARQRTFSLWGVRFGVVYIGERLGVLDIRARLVLVLSPTSIAALAAIIKLQ